MINNKLKPRYVIHYVDVKLEEIILIKRMLESLF